MLEWMERSGLRIDGPLREVYHRYRRRPDRLSSSGARARLVQRRIRHRAAGARRTARLHRVERNRGELHELPCIARSRALSHAASLLIGSAAFAAEPAAPNSIPGITTILRDADVARRREAADDRHEACECERTIAGDPVRAMAVVRSASRSRRIRVMAGPRCWARSSGDRTRSSGERRSAASARAKATCAIDGLRHGTRRSPRGARRKLRSRSDVDPQRIVVFGGSIGGTYAPLLAAGEDVAGVMIWGAGATTWAERMLKFERNALELGGSDPPKLAERNDRCGMHSSIGT